MDAVVLAMVLKGDKGKGVNEFQNEPTDQSPGCSGVSFHDPKRRERVQGQGQKGKGELSFETDQSPGCSGGSSRGPGGRSHVGT